MFSHSLSRRTALALALFALCAMQSGCVRRRMTVRSNPPGAQVFIDNQEVGITPCSASFTYYGTRQITLIKDGYRTENLYHRVNAPWYQYPPLDFVTETAVPHEIRDERVVDVQLVPQEVVPEAPLRQRAEDLRNQARTGQFTPTAALPGSAPAPTSVDAQTDVRYPGEGLPGSQPQPYVPTVTSPPRTPRLTPIEELLTEPPLPGAQP